MVFKENTILLPINIKNNDLEPIDFSDMLSLICATLLCFCISPGHLPSSAFFISWREIFTLLSAISYSEKQTSHISGICTAVVIFIDKNVVLAILHVEKVVWCEDLGMHKRNGIPKKWIP